PSFVSGIHGASGPGQTWIVVRVVVASKPADAVSRNSDVSGCVRRIEAGAIGETSPSRHIRTAAALRASGTTATIARDFRICRIDIVIARAGTSSSEWN